MRSIRKLSMLALALSSAGVMLAAPGAAGAKAAARPAAVSYANVAPGIARKLDRWAVLVKDTKTFGRLTDELYWPEAVITGEGAKRVYAGLDQIRAYFAPMAAAPLDLKFTVMEPTVTSGRLSTTLSEMVVKGPPGQPDMVASALMVWERRGTEWKIVRETYIYSPLK